MLSCWAVTRRVINGAADLQQAEHDGGADQHRQSERNVDPQQRDRRRDQRGERGRDARDHVEDPGLAVRVGRGHRQQFTGPQVGADPARIEDPSGDLDAEAMRLLLDGDDDESGTETPRRRQHHEQRGERGQPHHQRGDIAGLDGAVDDHADRDRHRRFRHLMQAHQDRARDQTRTIPCQRAAQHRGTTCHQPSSPRPQRVLVDPNPVVSGADRGSSHRVAVRNYLLVK